MKAFGRLAAREGFDQASAAGRYADAAAIARRAGPASLGSFGLRRWAAAPAEILGAALEGPLRSAAARIAAGLSGFPLEESLAAAAALGRAGAFADAGATARRWGLMARSGACAWRFVAKMVEAGWIDAECLARENCHKAARLALGSGAARFKSALARDQAKFVLRVARLAPATAKGEVARACAQAKVDADFFERTWARVVERPALARACSARGMGGQGRGRRL